MYSVYYRAILGLNTSPKNHLPVSESTKYF